MSTFDRPPTGRVPGAGRGDPPGTIDRRRFLHAAGLGSALLVATSSRADRPANPAARPDENPRDGSGPVTTVANHLGKPLFLVDGEPHLQPAFETYAPQLKYFRQFAAAGTKVHSFSICLGGYGFSPPVWSGPGKWDFAELDRRARTVLEARPDALILPRIYLGTPQWWLAAHPDEQQVLHDGSRTYPPDTPTPVPKGRPFASIASPRWRAEIAEGLRRILEHVQGSEYGAHLFGAMLTGLFTEEWYHWSSGSDFLSDYSPHMGAAFRDWLGRKYGSDEALRSAWNDADARIARAVIPSREERIGDRERTFRDPRREMKTIDFYLFFSDIVVETIDHFAAVARGATHGQKVVGAFYGYLFEFNGDPEFGHNAVSRLVRSSNLDFMMVTASYFDRELGTGADYMRSPMTSLALNGKLWYHDADTISFRYFDMMRERGLSEKDIGTTAAHLGVTTGPEETISMYRRGAGFTLGNGVYQSFFDLHGGYFDDERLMTEVARLNRVFEEASEHDRSSVAEILLVCDEASCSYATFRSPLLAGTLRPIQPGLTKTGAPHDCILVDDLARVDMERYRLVVFLNTFELGARQRQLIHDRVLGGDRRVVWAYAPGLFEGPRSSPSAMRDLTGLRIVAGTSGERVAPRVALKSAGHPLLERWRSAGLDEIGPAGKICELFHVEDEGATTLGTRPGHPEVTAALRDMGDWTSVYVVSPVLPSAFYRELARDAGVHLYVESGETLYASQGYLTLSVEEPGERVIRFPGPRRVTDPFTGEVVAENATELRRRFGRHETAILRLDSPESSSPERPAASPERGT